MNQNELNEWLQNHPNVKTSESFNIFSLLHKEHDEVRLHSRFISSLLDPKGPHGLGEKPLELFLKQINSNYKTRDLSNVIVRPNASNWTEEQEIDILIENQVKDKDDDKEKGFAIIIENKIFASDSNHVEEKDESDNAPQNNEGQLARYYRYITTGITPNEKRKRTITYNSNQVEVYYLTLDKHWPSKISLGSQLSVKGDKKEGTKEVNLIEYKEEICNWLDELLLEEDITIDVRSAITQYISLVKNLTGNLELNKKLFEFVGKEENWEDACNIFRLTEKDAEKLNRVEKLLFKNKRHVYWHALAAFFDDLSRELEEKLKPIGVTKVEHPENLAECVSNIIHQRGEKKKEHPYWSFWYEGIWWTIQLNEISQRFFFGVDRKHKENKRNLWEEKPFNEDWWLLEDLMPIVNPWDFTKGNTFDLLNEKKRQEIAQQYAEFVKQELAKV